jgi:hypothetical protein
MVSQIQIGKSGVTFNSLELSQIQWFLERSKIRALELDSDQLTKALVDRAQKLHYVEVFKSACAKVGFQFPLIEAKAKSGSVRNSV